MVDERTPPATQTSSWDAPADADSTMIRSTTILSALALSFLAACTSPEKAEEPVSAQVTTDGETVTEELDPNDPNVEQCPVTGALKRIDPDAEASAHGEGMEGDMPHGDGN